MILDQGYYFHLQCSDCGVEGTYTGERKEDAKKSAREDGWSLSHSTHACWCEGCKAPHQYVNKMKKYPAVGRT